MLVYQNLLEAMKTEKVTFLQMGKLLDCQYQTVSSIVNGSTKNSIMRMHIRSTRPCLKSTTSDGCLQDMTHHLIRTNVR